MTTPNMNDWLRRAAGFAPKAPSPEEPPAYVTANAGSGTGTKPKAPRDPNAVMNDLIRRTVKGW